MIIYNVTVNIDHDAHDQWLKWMQEEHIPDVLKCGVFTEARILKILADEDSGGTSYAIQYTCAGMKEYDHYRENFAPGLQKAAMDRFKDKFTAFRTLLETV